MTFLLPFWNRPELDTGAALAAGATATIPAARVETVRAANLFMLTPRARLPRCGWFPQFELRLDTGKR
jgi:hypothetical protein